jgi:site-specific DNA recombinase
MKTVAPKRQRCAIYMRKSTEHNLDLAFNSLDAQREACEAYIKSRAHEGWVLLRDGFDDGGLSVKRTGLGPAHGIVPEIGKIEIRDRSAK